MSRQLSSAAQAARRAALDALAACRPLTLAEQRERDNLGHRQYMRVWHQQQRDAARAAVAGRLARRIGA